MASQSMLTRLVWWVAGHFDGLTLLHVTQAPPSERKYVRIPEGLHPGVGCDRSGVQPIVGDRYTLLGCDYDLCEAEWRRLSAAEQRRFTKVEPRHFYRRIDEVAPPPVPLRPDLPPVAD